MRVIPLHGECREYILVVESDLGLKPLKPDRGAPDIMIESLYTRVDCFDPPA